MTHEGVQPHTIRREVRFRATNEETYSVNVSQHHIIITEDKVRLALARHIDRLGARYEWVAPASILVSILCVFAAARFNAPIWQDLFFLGGGACALWLVIALRRSGPSTPATIDTIVEEMKGSARTITSTSAGTVRAFPGVSPDEETGA